MLTFCPVLEEIAKVCYNTAYILVMTYVPASCILETGGHVGNTTTITLVP